MDSFAHFILTRFNVPLRFDKPLGDQPKHMGIDEGWLGRRFDLFERVCLGSVQRQTEGGFQWLVFMDWATPLPFKERSGLSETEFASRIGVGAQELSTYVAGTTSPSAALLVRMRRLSDRFARMRSARS